MCGIAGIVSTTENDSRSERSNMLRMLAMIRHRGPDQFGIYQDSSAVLGSARLSIIDLTTGQQPISNEDGRLSIVFNGEIFNYVELRSELQARGHRFKTNSDTEVLLHLYEEYGTDCLARLNGQFAFAIWDASSKMVLLARDRLGVRPLFYAEVNGTLLFASEMKALMVYPGMVAEIDPISLNEVFVYWSPLPGHTIFRGIRQLSPGHWLTFGHDRLCVRRYWDMHFPTATETSRDGEVDAYLGRFEELLVDATLLRLRSDVPVGAYLSGGLDSSVIAHIVATRTRNRLATFSVSFDDHAFDESAFQLRMSQLLGTTHHVVHATHADIARVFPDMVWHIETPITRTAPAPMFLLSKLVRDAGFKVVLTGEGADEFLAGYDIFKEAAIRQFWARHPGSRWRSLLLRRLYGDIAGMTLIGADCLAAFYQSGLSEVASPYYSHQVRWRNNARCCRFFSREMAAATAAVAGSENPLDLPAPFGSWGPLQRGQYLETNIFLSQYLLSSQGDRVAMAHSIESRFPFLDYRVVEFCNRLPSALKLRGLSDKYLLRCLARKFLPPEIWQRPKRPYRAPIYRSFFSKPVPDYVLELLSCAQIASAGFFKPAAVRQLVAKIQSGMPLGETDDMALAGILSTQLLNHQFKTNLKVVPPIPEHSENLKIVIGTAAETQQDGYGRDGSSKEAYALR